MSFNYVCANCSPTIHSLRAALAEKAAEVEMWEAVEVHLPEGFAIGDDATVALAVEVARLTAQRDEALSEIDGKSPVYWREAARIADGEWEIEKARAEAAEQERDAAVWHHNVGALLVVIERAEAAEQRAERLHASLHEIIHYEGGADVPQEDEYVMDRASEALAQSAAEEGSADG